MTKVQHLKQRSVSRILTIWLVSIWLIYIEKQISFPQSVNEYAVLFTFIKRRNTNKPFSEITTSCISTQKW